MQRQISDLKARCELDRKLYFRDQRLEASVARQYPQVSHKKRPDSLGLIGFDDNEGNLALAGQQHSVHRR